MSLVYNGTNWVQATTPVSQFIVTASDANGYEFQGAGFPAGQSADNPDIHLKKGQTYYFRNTSSGHPFRIQSTTGTGGTAYILVLLIIMLQDLMVLLYFTCLWTLHQHFITNVHHIQIW